MNLRVLKSAPLTRLNCETRVTVIYKSELREDERQSEERISDSQTSVTRFCRVESKIYQNKLISPKNGRG